MRQIKFTHSGYSAIFGAFASGDVLRCGDDAARHFVAEARCAQYDDAPAIKPPEPSVLPDLSPGPPNASPADDAAPPPSAKPRIAKKAKDPAP